MCPVQWVRPESRTRILPFCNVVKDTRLYILTTPDEHAQLLLHRIDSHGRTFPCLGDGECRHCAKEPFPYSYAAVVFRDDAYSKWKQGILGLGDPSHEIAATDYTGGELIVGRKDPKNKRSALTVYVGRVNPIDRPSLESLKMFDVRPFLMRRWGLFKEAELIGCDLRLPDPNYREPDPNSIPT